MVITNVNQVVYQGDGVTTAFPFTFRIIDATDIKLLLLDSDGTETDITSDYFVDTENDTVHYPGYAPGAEPALSDRPPVLAEGQKLVIYRKLPITQEKDLGDKWPFSVIELGLDKLTMILQDIWDWLGRCLCVSKGQAYEAGDAFDPTIPLEAGKVICGNENGTGFEAREALMEVNGAWDGEGRQIHSVANPTGNQDAATKKYVDTLTDNNFMKLQQDGNAWEGRSLPISNVANPTLQQQAATKNYVDSIIAGIVAAGNDVIVIDNVATMKATDLTDGMYVTTAGYHEVNDGGNGFYAIRVAQAGDVDDGGSIIFLENGNVAELIVIDEVNINQFGAVGDGSENDYNAIVNAAAYATKVNCRLVFLQGYTYYSSQPIVIENPPTEIRMDGALKYTGSGTALTIGTAGASVGGVNIKLFVVGDPSHTAGSKGVVLYNFDHSQIYLHDVRYFGDTAVTYCGNTKGFAYNTTNVGMIYSTPTLLKLTNIGAGWCNENKFFGGRFSVHSSDSFKANVVGVLITSDSENYQQNGNIFFSPSMEISTPVKIEAGRYNYFYNCRVEGATTPLLITNIRNSFNYMSSTYGCFGFTLPLTSSRYDVPGYKLVQKYTSNTLFDSGIIADNLAANTDYVSFAKLVTLYKSGVNYLLGTQTYVSNASITNGKLTLNGSNTSGIIGACIDTTNNKIFRLCMNGSVTGRIIIAMWDENGVMITDEVPLYISYESTAMNPLSLVSGRSWYNIASTEKIPNNRLYIVPDKCTKAFIGIGAVGTLERFTVLTENLATYDSLQNNETAVLSSIPTSVGKVGQFVKKSVPTQGEVGWVYDGTNWLSVG